MTPQFPDILRMANGQLFGVKTCLGDKPYGVIARVTGATSEPEKALALHALESRLREKVAAL